MAPERYHVPTFREYLEQPPAPQPKPQKVSIGPGRQRKVPADVVAAVRWDYEHEKMRLIDIAKKYGMHRATVWHIAHRKTHRGIKAAEMISNQPKE